MKNDFKNGACVPCLRAGHDCPAIDVQLEEGEEAKCAFCEDGLPCPRSKNGGGDKAQPTERLTDCNGRSRPKELPMKEKKQCGRDGCEKQLTAANRSGYCSDHFYDSKRRSDVPKLTAVTRRRDPQIRARGGQSNGHSKPDDMGVLQVSRDQLVAMFSAWPLQDQVGCVQLWLNRISGML